MLARLPADTIRFDGHRRRSLTETTICGNPALSKLDNTLGQLYWKARRRVVSRRAFLDDSDSNWARPKATPRAAACRAAHTPPGSTDALDVPLHKCAGVKFNATTRASTDSTRLANMFDTFERVHRESSTANAPCRRTIHHTNPQHSFGETK